MEVVSTYHDINVNGTNYILEWIHSEEGVDRIEITQATSCEEWCKVSKSEPHGITQTCPGCDQLECYDFTEGEN